MTAVLSTRLTPPQALTALRTESPLVQCVTNAVASSFTANVLIALGAAPAMVDIPSEAGEFAAHAHASVVNLGTPRAEQREAAREVVAATHRWVLDPVAVGTLPVRTDLAAELLESRPAIIRANASEVLALAGMSRGGRGVDSTSTPEQALDAGRSLACDTGAVVAISGSTDLITNGFAVVRVHGGHALLTRITGSGCALGAVMAAFLGVCEPFSAAIAASTVFARASEQAALEAGGPGSFAVAFLDALYTIQPTILTLDERPHPQNPRVQEFAS